MSYDERSNARPNVNDDSDAEEEALVNDYREQVHFEDGMSDLDRTTSLGGASHTQDLQAQLTAAATPLEYQATLETKFASYDNYCSLFHYILNSEGPVELEAPSVCEVLVLVEVLRAGDIAGSIFFRLHRLTYIVSTTVLLGLGCH
jgi:translation initiation factor 3 subunit L